MFGQYRQARKIHLIGDGGPSHVSGYTRQFLRNYRGRVRVLLTPPHAGWLNQGELLLRAFSARYLRRGNWSSREHLALHLLEATEEYDRLFAHPFTWSWTRQDLRRWIEQKNQRLESSIDAANSMRQDDPKIHLALSGDHAPHAWSAAAQRR
jgi:hypothetical protein